jgi:hypothetical protein
MISGGIQHFEEEMHYASQLIPIGLFVSAVGFVWRTKGTISLKNVTIVLFVMFALSGMVKYGLHYIVDHNPEISEDTHGGHSH